MGVQRLACKTHIAHIAHIAKSPETVGSAAWRTRGTVSPQQIGLSALTTLALSLKGVSQMSSILPGGS